MGDGWSAGRSRAAMVADVGRSAIRIGVTDESGRLRHDSVRSYGPAAQPTVSGAISTFAREAGLPALPPRLAVAVSGNPRGETVAVTNGRWRVSRSGLAVMFQASPLIVNDFAANAWAVGSPECAGKLEALAGGGAAPHGPGAFLVLGVGSGLGVALLSRDAHGVTGVHPTEAGHAAFPGGLKGAEPLVEAVGLRHGFATSEMLVSGPGLQAVHAAVAKRRNARPGLAPEVKEIVRLGLSARDPVAAEALALFANALWHLAGNLVLTFGAWDGVVLTGGLAAAIRPLLARADLAEPFALPGPYRRELAAVPRSLVGFRYAELEGAAAALRVEEARRGSAVHALAA